MSCQLVVYDIANPRRLRRVAKVMQHFGVRVQKSVFECELSSRQVGFMVNAIGDGLVEEEDQVRIYTVTKGCIHSAVRLGRPGDELPGLSVVV